MTNVKNSEDHIPKEGCQLLIHEIRVKVRYSGHRSHLFHVNGSDVTIIKFSEYTSVDCPYIYIVS